MKDLNVATGQGIEKHSQAHPDAGQHGERQRTKKEGNGIQESHHVEAHDCPQKQGYEHKILDSLAPGLLVGLYHPVPFERGFHPTHQMMDGAKGADKAAEHPPQ